MSFATDLKSMGQDLLQEYGQSITFSRTTEGSFVPSTGDVAGESTSTYIAYGAPMNFTLNESDNIRTNDNYTLRTALRLWVEANSSGYIPTVGDVATFSGQSYRVLEVIKHQAQGLVAVYELRVSL